QEGLMRAFVLAVFEFALAPVRWLYGDRNEADGQMFDDALHRLITSGEGAIEPEPRAVRDVASASLLPPSPFMEMCIRPAAEFVRGFDPGAFMAEIIPLFSRSKFAEAA